MSHDVFICHASEDKDALVRPLAEALRDRNVDVWYDEFSMQVGDSLRQSIDRGLAASRYGVVVFSPAFFAKSWPHYELDGLVERLVAERRRLILPIWHGVTPEEVRRYSPPLAGTVAANSSAGVEAVCDQLLRVIHPVSTPLEGAKRILLDYDWDPPPTSDPWWIDMVGVESDVHSPYGARRPWLFPHPPIGVADDRGNAIAWAILQNDWNWEADEAGVCQITRPEKVFEFIDSNAALADACAAHPAVVANYAPQLLIPRFSGRFASAFDELLTASEAEIRGQPDSRFPHATCERELALRAPGYGGHHAEDVTDKWMNGRRGDHSAAQHPTSDYLMWLLSDDSRWLPDTVRQTLTKGMRDYGRWPLDLLREEVWGRELTEAFYARRRTPFKWTRTRQRELEEAAGRSLARLGVPGDPVQVASAFIDLDFVGEMDRQAATRGGHW